MNKTQQANDIFNDILKQYEHLKGNKDYDYKVKHSYRVAEISKNLAESEGLDEDLSYTIGLLHDVGRFEQTNRELAIIGNNNKEDTVLDHGELGFNKLVNNKKFWNFIDNIDISIILQAVENHNKLTINYRVFLFKYYNIGEYCKMIRDADKIDIIEHFATKQEFIEDGISPKVMESYNNKELVKHEDIKTSQDKSMQFLCYQFDLNFQYSKDRLKQIFRAIKQLNKIGE